MKTYEIYDEENDRSIGTLIYYDKEGSYIIELQDDLDEWTAPLLLTGFVKKHTYTIPRDISFLWVQGRIIPSGRQNINDILSTHRLKSYDEMKFLEISEGRCSQDSLYIRKIQFLPEYVVERQQHNLIDVSILDNHRLLCFFKNNNVKIIELTDMYEVKGIDKVLKHDNLFQSGKIGTGGYFITFNDSIDIPSSILYENGLTLPLTFNDFTIFIKNNVLDTSESCRLLECSRQNISYMVKRNQLNPIKEERTGTLYLKGDLLKNTW